MARKKVKLAWIPNHSARRATMRKRRQSLLKKVKELSILCGVPAFCAIYCRGEPEPLVWPTDREEAEHVLTRFLGMPAVEQSKKMTNQETYLREKLAKLQDLRRDQVKLLNELELAYLMDQVFYGRRGLDGLDLYGMKRLSALLEEKRIEVRKKAVYFEVELKRPGGDLNSANVTDGDNNIDNNAVGPGNPNLLWQEDDYLFDLNSDVFDQADDGNDNDNDDLFDVVRSRVD